MHNVFSQSIVLSHQASHKFLSNPDFCDHSLRYMILFFHYYSEIFI